MSFYVAGLLPPFFLDKLIFFDWAQNVNTRSGLVLFNYDQF